MDDERTINLTLTLDECNLILEALGNMPFKSVYQVIGKIQQQAGQQLDGQAGPLKMEEKKEA